MGIVRQFETAFNRQDVDGLLRCFAPEASYVDTFFGEHRGHDRLREMFERMFREGRDYRWRMERVVESPECAAAEWQFSYIVSEAVPRSAGRAISFPGMSVFELADGRVTAYREHFDLGAAMLQLGFAPEAVAKVLRRRRLAAGA